MPISFISPYVSATSTYPVNVVDASSDEPRAPKKIDFKAPSGDSTVEGTVWEPDYLKFECRGKNAFWMGFLSGNGALAETADPDIEYSFDRLNWSRVPTHLADAVEFGDQATNPQHKEIFLRAMMTPGQPVRTTSPLHNENSRFRHFCWRDPAYEIPEELVYASGVAIAQGWQMGLNRTLASYTDTSTYASDFTIYHFTKEYCEANGVTKLIIAGSSSMSYNQYKQAMVVGYAKGSNFLSAGADVNLFTIGEVAYLDFDSRSATDLFISCPTGYLYFDGDIPKDTTNGVIVSGSISSLIDGSGNADWAQDHICPNTPYLFLRLFSPHTRDYNYISPDHSYPAIIDAYNLRLPYDSDSSKTSICTGNKYQNIYGGLFSNSIYLRRAPKELPLRTLSKECYKSTFAYCGALTVVPSVLPATSSVGTSVYLDMFTRCVSLETPPVSIDLLITGTATSNSNGYNAFQEMFYRCTSLKSVPKIKTPLFHWSTCKSMFQNCISLESIPSDFLPETYTTNDACFSTMFSGCTSLKNVPADLFSRATNTSYPASIFQSTFQDCTSLVTPPNIPDKPYGTAASVFQSTFRGCTSLTDASNVQIHFNEGSGGLIFGEMFMNCSSLTGLPSVIGSTTISSTSTRQYTSMFANSGVIDVSAWSINTNIAGSNRGTFYSMFKNCNSLIKGPSHFHIVSNATATGYNDYVGICGFMFSGCTNLETCGVDSDDNEDFYIEFSSVGESPYHFYNSFTNCKGLTTTPYVNIKSTHKCDSICRNMFQNCKTITRFKEGSSLEFTRLDEYSLAYFMDSCDSLQYGPNLSVKGTIANNGMLQFAAYCNSLQNMGDIFEIDSTVKNTACKNAFGKCSALKKGPSLFKVILNAGSAETCAQMFEDCTSMETLGEEGFTIEGTTLGNRSLYHSFYNCKSLESAPTVFKLSGALADNACTETFGGPSGPYYPLGCNAMDLDFANVDFSGVTSFGASACQAMFNGCLKAHGACPAFPPSATLANNCFRQMYADCANMVGLPDIPYENLGATQYTFMQTFWNVGNPTHGGTRPTSCNCHFKSGTGANATQAMFAHIDGVQFHVPAGNPYGWIADSTAIAPPHKHLRTSFTIIDDL